MSPGLPSVGFRRPQACGILSDLLVADAAGSFPNSLGPHD